MKTIYKYNTHKNLNLKYDTNLHDTNGKLYSTVKNYYNK